MLFLNADFWPLFWAVIGGGAGLTAVLSLFATTVVRPHHAQTVVPAEAVPAEAAPTQAPPAEAAQPMRAA
jgi:hypothetical protein